MDSNLRPYRLLRINDLTYSFTTDSGDKYKCSFLSYADYFANYPEIASNVFSFNLVSASKSLKHKGIDKKIAVTVVHIVAGFLISRINAVVYVCDPSDDKAAARARKFKSWFKYYEHPSHQILQLNTDMEAGGVKIYTALLVHKKNKLKKKFVEAYMELTDVDDDDK
jgi:Family of unknown function (DUF6169)